MKKLFDYYCKGLEVIIVVALVLMVLLIFSNVVLRYAFNSGIALSEEISRWLFVWITFLGAIVALHERRHLGSDFLVGKLPPGGKKVCLCVGYLLMLFVCWLLFSGALEQTTINWDVTAPTSGAPVAIFYASGIVFSISAGLFIAFDLFNLLTGKLADQELVIIRESEDQL
jgi:TRAP-type C4-dicarboxylate transport system permease small subunit